MTLCGLHGCYYSNCSSSTVLHMRLWRRNPLEFESRQGWTELDRIWFCVFTHYKQDVASVLHLFSVHVLSAFVPDDLLSFHIMTIHRWFFDSIYCSIQRHFRPVFNVLPTQWPQYGDNPQNSCRFRLADFSNQPIFNWLVIQLYYLSLVWKHFSWPSEP